MAMRMPMNRTRFRILFVGLVAWVGLGFAVSCSSSDQASGEGRVEHPDPTAKAPTPSTHPAPPAEPTAATSAPAEPSPSVSEMDGQPSGKKLPPLDKAIAEDDPARPWSKNVPTRSCKSDGECGDGFC